LDLETLINHSYPKGMPHELATAILTQIALGLRVLHRQHIVHRELNANHIRFKKFDPNNPKKIQVQIAEFGSSKRGRANTLLGQAPYRAPEVGEYEYDTKADIFSLGTILMLMLTGNQENMMVPIRKFLEKEENLLKSMLHLDPNYRPTIDQLLDKLEYKPKIKEIRETEKRVAELYGTNIITTEYEQEKIDQSKEVDDIK
jgi:serine/threonine protein kinase